MRPHQDNEGRWDNIKPLPTRTEPEVTVPLVTSHKLASNADTEGVGSIVGNRYLLQTHIGRGRLGERYEAVDQQLTQAGQNDYRVLLERFTLRNSHTPESTRFASEFVGLLSIAHPNIARVIDYGIDGKTNFIVTELLEGVSLRAILDSASNEAFTEDEVLAVVGGVADALKFTHSKNLVHGDLSPESIFITSEFDVKVADFATVVLARTQGSIIEKQAGGSQSRKSSADVFGLAAIAYELLANEPPYGWSSRHEARVRGSELRRLKNIPRYQWKALARALALQSRKRTPSVAEFAAEFGVSGTETVMAAAAVRRSAYRRLLWPALALLAVAATAVFLQSGETSLSEVFSDLRDRAETELAAALPGDSRTEAIPEVPADTEGASADTQENSPPVDAEQVTAEQASPALSQETAVSVDGAAGEELSTTDVAAMAVTSAPDAPSSDADQSAATSVLPSGKPDVESGTAQPLAAAEDALPNVAASGVASPAAEQLTISFEQDVVVAFESQDMAPITIRRQGPVDVATSILWWTGDNTAVADHDYAELGVRQETFAAGEERMTVFVPLVSDSIRENRESFYAYVGSDLTTKKVADRLEVVVVDNN